MSNIVLNKFLMPLLVAGCAAASPVFADYLGADPCSSSAEDAFLAQRELDDFQNLVVVPLRQALERTQAQLNFKINRPAALRQAIANDEKQMRSVQAEFDRVQGVIATETAQADQAEANVATFNAQADELAKQASDLAAQADEALKAGNKEQAAKLRKQANQVQNSATDARQKAKHSQKEATNLRNGVLGRQKNQAARQAQIAKIQADNEARAQEIASIEGSAPSIDELQMKVNELQAQLADTRALRDQRVAKLAHEQDELNMCRSNAQLQRDFMDLQMRYNDVVSRCTPH